MATDRTAKVTWAGSLMEGAGQIEGVDSGAFGPLDVTWASRAESPEGRTSPEELIAAAWASCFSMALSHGLAGAGTPAERLEASVTVTFQPGEGITKGAIVVVGTVPGVDHDAFVEARRGREGQLPRLEGAHRGPRGHARRDARELRSKGLAPKVPDPSVRLQGHDRLALATRHWGTGTCGASPLTMAPWQASNSWRTSSSARTRSSRSGWPIRPSTRTAARRPSSGGA